MNNLEEQLEQQYMENEIQSILDNITPTEYKSLKEIEEIRSMVVNKIYDEFMHYEINNTNKQESIQQLEGYECVDIDELKKGNYIKYFNMKVFYNLKLITGGTVIEVFDNGNVFKKKIHVPAETCVTFELNMQSSFKKFLSWKCKSSVGTVEIFWVSYNEKNGGICGDHSF